MLTGAAQQLSIKPLKMTMATRGMAITVRKAAIQDLASPD